MERNREEMGEMDWCYNSLVSGFVKKSNRKIRKTFIKKGNGGILNCECGVH